MPSVLQELPPSRCRRDAGERPGDGCARNPAHDQALRPCGRCNYTDEVERIVICTSASAISACLPRFNTAVGGCRVAGPILHHCCLLWIGQFHD
jgi:hypothetical protein